MHCSKQSQHCWKKNSSSIIEWGKLSLKKYHIFYSQQRQADDKNALVNFCVLRVKTKKQKFTRIMSMQQIPAGTVTPPIMDAMDVEPDSKMNTAYENGEMNVNRPATTTTLNVLVPTSALENKPMDVETQKQAQLKIRELSEEIASVVQGIFVCTYFFKIFLTRFTQGICASLQQIETNTRWKNQNSRTIQRLAVTIIICPIQRRNTASKWWFGCLLNNF